MTDGDRQVEARSHAAGQQVALICADEVKFSVSSEVPFTSFLDVIIWIL